MAEQGAGTEKEVTAAATAQPHPETPQLGPPLQVTSLGLGQARKQQFVFPGGLGVPWMCHECRALIPVGQTQLSAVWGLPARRALPVPSLPAHSQGRSLGWLEPRREPRSVER